MTVDRIRAVRHFAFVLAALAHACRSVPQGPDARERRCFPASGSEVWIERHLRARSTTDGRSTVEVRFVPDTASQRRGHHPQALLLVRTQGAERYDESLRRTITLKTPGAIRLMPGTYGLRVSAISYEHVLHAVEVAPGDSILIDVRLPGAAYCEEIVTVQ
jgi:hypothetical protein